MIRPGRSITGVSATLLPFTGEGAPDWDGFERHLARTAEAGLVPAVNMDTGYVNRLDDKTRTQVLDRTARTLGDQPFVAGAFVDDAPGDDLDLDAYRRRIDEIQQHGGTPIIFQSYGLTQQGPDDILEAYRVLGTECPEYIAFELGEMFAPFGAIYDLETYAGLMELPGCIGAKHSSLDRELEWKRLALRDERAPDFKVFTGNDLAIDMVTYGSDYLLGLSTFAPDLFAVRDQLWEEEDPSFYALNDLLQYLGFLAFREPVPAYKHSAAYFLHIRGWLDEAAPHPDGQRRPESDRPLLRNIAERLADWAP
ncbi:MAG: dihydrodipicolinate synthase family protein [Salinivenus sp.]